MKSGCRLVLANRGCEAQDNPREDGRTAGTNEERSHALWNAWWDFTTTGSPCAADFSGNQKHAKKASFARTAVESASVRTRRRR
jgi:hypothetical protein